MDILIVEDDHALNEGIQLTLRQEGYRFYPAHSLKEARELWNRQEYQLVLLDINLPDGTGYDLCVEIRRKSRIPILIITANDLEMDEVMGLQMGADDYITKPFRLMVLRARVEALIRRAGMGTKEDVFCIDDFVFDFSNYSFRKKGVELVISRTEQKLLHELLLHKGKILTREQLLDRIWTDGAEYVDENALSVSINRLRNKLEDTPSKPGYIQTVYGIGYTWAEKKDE